jgi:hypothetical protein
VYDPFRNRFLLTEDEAKARDWRTAKKFIGYEFQQVGGGIIWKFYPGEERPRQQTEGQKILELPILSSVIGRWIKITNYGEVERLRSKQADVARSESRARLREREAVADALVAYQRLPASRQTPDTMVELARGVVKELYSNLEPREQVLQLRDVLKKLRMGVARGHADPLVDAVMSATSNAQKAAIIAKATETMTIEELRAWFARALHEEIVSEAVARSVLAERLRQPAVVGR